MARKPPPPTAKVITMKVTLDESRPPIWRRFEVTSNIALGDLHHTLQFVMGWTDSHLHEFIINNKHYGRPSPDTSFPDDPPLIDEREIELGSVVKRKGQKFRYIYDYGDDWEHIVLVERIGPVEAGVLYPVCLDGERACPPEDCGGIFGYYEMLEVLKNPGHEEYKHFREWLRSDFDPEVFDAIATDQLLDDMDKWRFDWDY